MGVLALLAHTKKLGPTGSSESRQILSELTAYFLDRPVPEFGRRP